MHASVYLYLHSNQYCWMVAAMRFTEDIRRLFGIGIGTSERKGEQPECGSAEISNQRANDAALTPDGLMGEEGFSEEERARRRAERRRAKRKRQRQRKKLEQVGKNESAEQDEEDEDEKDSVQLESEESGSEKEDEVVICQGVPVQLLAASGNRGDHHASCSPCEEDPGWDVSSAFYANAASHIKPKSRLGRSQGSKENKENEVRTREVDPADLVAKRSTSLAEKGIKLWKEQKYTQAVSMFTEAIHCDPKDHRFFGNRSSCYECLGNYTLALADAEESIRLAPHWPYGYFRKGRALMGMKQYDKAEEAMEQVLKLDANCKDATYDLYNCKLQQLLGMGFQEPQSKQLLEKYATVQDAVTSPEAARILDLNSVQNQSGSPCVSLWVGNVTTDVSEKHLLSLFKTFGEIESIRVLHERFCAFVNFRNSNMAALAMEKLQGVEIEDTKLVIRYPDRQRAVPSPQRPTSGTVPLSSQLTSAAGSRRKGPTNGDECYFWRTSGCYFGDKCRYKHIPEQRGRDRKPWQPS
ncbi:uncharacterized protein zgc:123010 isoform X2 [Brienomyrus brachyistius]|uniref:uncharacterized protein zgc:123010 isoform X2 n=1 Tax=Brienomyrus brachyistius TaxID=42636 RepID=UPI0020B2327F|nr:uncharacterized protein zgc:123010 isoform X2 [Brienomyrus brachyistius]